MLEARVRPAPRHFLLPLLLIPLLASVHAVASEGGRLPEGTQRAVGASAETALSRPVAHFTAPAFHTTWGHLLYNSVVLLLAAPVAARAFGARAPVAAYLASPLAGILVDLAVVLPLAAAGVPFAVDAAPMRLVGASVMAFAFVGLALVGLGARRIALVLALSGIAAYEATLALSGLTDGFVWCYHLAGLALGVAAGLWLSRRSPASRASPSPRSSR